jgi:hypothetical protein
MSTGAVQKAVQQQEPGVLALLLLVLVPQRQGGSFQT